MHNSAHFIHFDEKNPQFVRIPKQKLILADRRASVGFRFPTDGNGSAIEGKGKQPSGGIPSTPRLSAALRNPRLSAAAHFLQVAHKYAEK